MKKPKVVPYRLIHPDGSRVYQWLQATAFHDAPPGSTIDTSCPPHVMSAITSAKQLGGPS